MDDNMDIEKVDGGTYGVPKAYGKTFKNRPDSVLPTKPVGVTAAEQYLPATGHSAHFNPHMPDRVPVEKTDQVYVATEDSLKLSERVMNGNTFTPYKLEANNIYITLDETQEAGQTANKTGYLEDVDKPAEHPLQGFASYPNIPRTRDDGRGFETQVKISTQNLNVPQITVDLPPLNTRNPTYPVSQPLVGMFDVDFMFEEYGPNKIHGLVVSGGPMVDNDNITLLPNGEPVESEERLKIRATEMPLLMHSRVSPAGAQDLVLPPGSLVYGNPLTTSLAGNGQSLKNSFDKYTKGGDRIGTMFQYNQRQWPTYSGQDTVQERDVDKLFCFPAEWQNRPGGREIVIPGSVYNSANMRYGETGTTLGNTNARYATDIIGRRVEGEPNQQSLLPPMKQNQHLYALNEILESAPTTREQNPYIVSADPGGEYSQVNNTNDEIYVSQIEWLNAVDR